MWRPERSKGWPNEFEVMPEEVLEQGQRLVGRMVNLASREDPHYVAVVAFMPQSGEAVKGNDGAMQFVEKPKFAVVSAKTGCGGPVNPEDIKFLTDMRHDLDHVDDFRRAKRLMLYNPPNTGLGGC